jgi:hypothetical protein
MNNLTEDQMMQAENDYWVDMAESLARLHDNPDFQKVVLKGYFTDKAVNSVSLLAKDSIVETGRRSAVMEDLIAVSSLQDHFITIRNLGTVSIEDDAEQ